MGAAALCPHRTRRGEAATPINSTPAATVAHCLSLCQCTGAHDAEGKCGQAKGSHCTKSVQRRQKASQGGSWMRWGRVLTMTSGTACVMWLLCGCANTSRCKEENNARGVEATRVATRTHTHKWCMCSDTPEAQPAAAKGKPWTVHQQRTLLAGVVVGGWVGETCSGAALGQSCAQVINKWEEKRARCAWRSADGGRCTPTAAHESK